MIPHPLFSSSANIRTQQLIVEAGSKPEKALEPEEQGIIATCLGKYPMLQAVKWHQKIDLALPKLASVLAHAYYDRSTSHEIIEDALYYLSAAL